MRYLAENITSGSSIKEKLKYINEMRAQGYIDSEIIVPDRMKCQKGRNLIILVTATEFQNKNLV